MKQLIARLRALKLEADKPENDNVPTLVPGIPMDEYIMEALRTLPQLLDRLEKLETVAEAAQRDHDPSFELARALDALAALEST